MKFRVRLIVDGRSKTHIAAAVGEQGRVAIGRRDDGIADAVGVADFDLVHGVVAAAFAPIRASRDEQVLRVAVDGGEEVRGHYVAPFAVYLDDRGDRIVERDVVLLQHCVGRDQEACVVQPAESGDLTTIARIEARQQRQRLRVADGDNGAVVRALGDGQARAVGRELHVLDRRAPEEGLPRWRRRNGLVRLQLPGTHNTCEQQRGDCGPRPRLDE